MTALRYPGGTCAECGAPIDRRARRCGPCWYASRRGTRNPGAGFAAGDNARRAVAARERRRAAERAELDAYRALGKALRGT